MDTVHGLKNTGVPLDTRFTEIMNKPLNIPLQNLQLNNDLDTLQRQLLGAQAMQRRGEYLSQEITKKILQVLQLRAAGVTAYSNEVFGDEMQQRNQINGRGPSTPISGTGRPTPNRWWNPAGARGRHNLRIGVRRPSQTRPRITVEQLDMELDEYMQSCTPQALNSQLEALDREQELLALDRELDEYKKAAKENNI